MPDTAEQRVREFLRQWTTGKHAEEIYGVHKDPDAEMATLYVSDLLALLHRSARESEVLRTAQAEYLAGHRSDAAVRAQDRAVVHTDQDRTEYQRALISHYTAIRALLRTLPAAQPAKETPTDV